MALLMLDEGAFKIQKKAIFSFLTKKEKEANTSQLLANPFNWKSGQDWGTLGVTFSLQDFVSFLGTVYEIRNAFNSTSVEEPLEIPCQILGAQIWAVEAQLENGDVEESTRALLLNTIAFNRLVNDKSLEQSSLKTVAAETEVKLREKTTQVLKLVLKDIYESEEELQFL